MPDILFEAMIVPHRSLSRRGLRLLLAGIGAICVANVVVFSRLHAWPVCGFAGGELVLAAVLLRLNALGAKASELLLLTPDALRVVRTDPKGRREERVLSPAWLNVEVEERPGRVPALWVGSHGVREELGRVLGEAEKRDLARALAEALHRWRNPVFDNPQLAE
ncbi:MAG TPA: DUF2244 domain-containing protein [Acetobacteraceae bacterium]|nr:DUF2244 domain-containing protein [Acetobacteraceae bacterium]